MKAAWKTALGIVAALGLLLLPIAYADETVAVSLYRNGEEVSSAGVGEIITLHSVLESASQGDSVRFERTGPQIQFISEERSDTVEVPVVLNEEGLWTAETEAKVVESGTIQVKANVIREDASEPMSTYSAYVKPENLQITTSTDTALPGERVTATASLTPAEGTDYNLLRNVSWSISCSGVEIKTDNSQGEVIGFDVPQEAQGKTIIIAAELAGDEETGITTLTAQEEAVQVKEDKLTVNIYPSTDADGILTGQDLGFSSEILNGSQLAGTDLTDGSHYTWSAQLDREYINGQSKGETFSVNPERAGQLKVQLRVDLSDGTSIESEPVIKTVTESESPLTGVNIRMKALEGSDDVIIGEPVSFTKTLEPAYATNLDEAAYKWTAEQNGQVIAEFGNPADFWFVPEEPGNIKVQLSVTPQEGTEIVSEPVLFDVTRTGADDKSYRLLSAKIKANRDTTNLKAGDEVVMNAEVDMEGEQGIIQYHWVASDDSGNVLAASDKLNDFTFASNDAALVSVKFTAQVLENADGIEAQETDSTGEELEQEQSEKSMITQTDSDLNTESNTSTDTAQNSAQTKDNKISDEQGDGFEETIAEEPDQADKMAQSEMKTKKADPDAPNREEDKTEEDAVLDSKEIKTSEEPQYKTVTDEMFMTFLPALTEAGTENVNSDSSEQNKTGVSKQNMAANSTLNSGVPRENRDSADGTVVSGNTNNSNGTGTGSGKASTITGNTYTSGSGSSEPSYTSTVRASGSNTGGITYTSNKTIPVTAPTVKAGNVQTAFTTPTSITNPQTGRNLTRGELAVIITCTCLITISSLTLLRRKRRNKKSTSFYL